jgi:hypothetical protein
MPAHNANLRAEGLLSQWNFPNNYTLSKHLAEYMIADYQKHFAMPIAIVRPTLISSVARDPYPGERGWVCVVGGAELALWAHSCSSGCFLSCVWHVLLATPHTAWGSAQCSPWRRLCASVRQPGVGVSPACHPASGHTHETSLHPD